MKPPSRYVLAVSSLVVMACVTSTFDGVHGFHTNYPTRPMRYHSSPTSPWEADSAPTPTTTMGNSRGRRPAFVLHESFRDSVGSMTKRAFGMFTARGSRFMKKRKFLSATSQELEPRPPSTPPPLDVMMIQERLLGEMDSLAGKVLEQIPVFNNNANRIQITEELKKAPLQPKPPSSPPPPPPEEETLFGRLVSKFRLGGGGNRRGNEPERKEQAETAIAARGNPENDDDGDGDDDDKFSLGQRIESIKAAIVGALSGGIVSTPFIFLHDVALADSSANGIAQWEFDTDMGSLEAALFALVYRYAVREDTNPMLQQGAVGAFVLVRTLSRVKVSSGCDAIPLSCGAPLGYFDWPMLTETALNGIESAAMFGAAAVAMEYCFNNNFISKFR